MRAVVDAGPVIHLSWIDRLDLLDQLFEEVFLPPAVRDEVLAPPPGTLGLAHIEDALARHRLQVRAPSALFRPIGPLHIGEIEAISLALELAADVLITDDSNARREAVGRGSRSSGLWVC